MYLMIFMRYISIGCIILLFSFILIDEVYKEELKGESMKKNFIKCPACSSLLEINSLKKTKTSDGYQTICKYCKTKLLVKEKREVIAKKACKKIIVSVL